MESEIKTWEGDLSAEGLHFAIVVSRFNSFVTERLLSGCLDALRRSGAKMEEVEKKTNATQEHDKWNQPQ